MSRTMSRAVTAASSPSPRRSPRRSSGPLLSRLLAIHASWQQRQRLATLDDAALRDIGVSRGQAETEAARSVWNAPSQWLR